MSATRSMTRTERREAARELAKTSAKFPKHLVEVGLQNIGATPPPGLIKVFRSREYLVQVFEEPAPCVCRLTVNRTKLDGSNWQADIGWEDLQRLKNEAGYHGRDAVEVFPRQNDVVNVANMRHIFVMAEPLSFAWRRT